MSERILNQMWGIDEDMKASVVVGRNDELEY
jgi:hypothetical protein